MIKCLYWNTIKVIFFFLMNFGIYIWHLVKKPLQKEKEWKHIYQVFISFYYSKISLLLSPRLFMMHWRLRNNAIVKDLPAVKNYFSPSVNWLWFQWIQESSWTQIINTWNRKIVLEKSFVQKWKSLNLGLTMSYSGSFRTEFEKNIFIFEINTLEFVYLQSPVQKWKFLNLGPKILYLGIFGLEFLKPVVIFKISTLKCV